MSDLFHKELPLQIIDRTVATIAASDHIGLLVTKRVERMAELFLSPTRARWQAKVWLGFSAERQLEFDRRWPVMRPLAERGWLVFVSIAPMLGAVTLPDDFLSLARWVIVNGEEKTAHHFIRRMDVRWARALRNQCKAAHIPFFFKGLGAQRPIPRDLSIREFPRWPA